MQKLLVILILVLIGFLSSCRGIPPKSDFSAERCFTVITEEIIQEDGSFLYSGYCRCHSWSISKDQIGRSGESENKPLMYCHKNGGLNGENWSNFVLFLEDWRLYLRKQ